MKNSEAILVTPKHFEIQECPVPEPKDHEILMKVEYVGMCGSDIHGFEFGPFIPPKDPNQKIGLGHEVAGEVVKIGAKVTKFKVGDKVLIEPIVPPPRMTILLPGCAPPRTAACIPTAAGSTRAPSIVVIPSGI